MTYILSRQLLGGKYSKWIVILQEFDLEFTTAKSTKSLVFANLICSLLIDFVPFQFEDHIPDETLFLISTHDPWYGNIIMYLQTSTFRSKFTKDARRRIRHQSQPYRIIGDTLYRVRVDSVLRRCLTLEEVERVLNDCHSGTYGGHMFGYATAQKILRAGYFWPSIFRLYCCSPQMSRVPGFSVQYAPATPPSASCHYCRLFRKMGRRFHDV